MAFPIPQDTPTTPPIVEKEPEVRGSLKHLTTDTNNLDALLDEFNTPRQDFSPPPPEPEIENPFSLNPENKTNIFDPYQETISAPITPEEARANGKNTAKFLDTGISFGLKMYARDESAKPYKATPEEIEEMAVPLAEISEKYNFKISPEITLAFLIFTIYLPKYFVAVDKRTQALEKRTDDLEAKFSALNIEKP